MIFLDCPLFLSFWISSFEPSINKQRIVIGGMTVNGFSEINPPCLHIFKIRWLAALKVWVVLVLWNVYLRFDFRYHNLNFMSDTLSTITTTATSPHPLTLELLVLFYRIIHPLEHQNVHLLLCHLQMLLHFCNYTTNSFIC